MNKEYIVLTVKEYALLVSRSEKIIRGWIKEHKIRATRLAKHHAWDIEVEEAEYDRLKHKKKHRETKGKV